MIAAIIGSTKIAKIHYQNLLHLNYKRIYFVSRTKKKSETFIKNNIERTDTCVPENYKIFKKLKFNLIIICTNTDYHFKTLNNLESNQDFIIIEKPLISASKYKKNYKLILKEIYNKQKNLIVNYPMYFLGKNFLKKYSFSKKIKNLKIFYFTNGNHNYDNIGVDLLPHGLSLAFVLFKNLDLTKNIKQFYSISRKYSWYGKISYEDFEIEFFFKQNIKKKSQFFFKLNNEVIKRPTFQSKKTFTNYLEYKNKKIKISNPMNDFILFCHKHHKNKKWFLENKKITEKILNINHQFLLNK